MRAKIVGINIINTLYEQMVEAGYIEAYKEPRATRDKYEVVRQNIDTFLEEIRANAVEINEILDANDISNIGQKEGEYTATPWKPAETAVMYTPKHNIEYVAPGVSLAISNHYLNNLAMNYDESHSPMLPVLEIAKNLATSNWKTTEVRTDEEKNKLSLGQRVAKRLQGNKWLMRIPFVRNFATRQLQALPLPTAQATTVSDRGDTGQAFRNEVNGHGKFMAPEYSKAEPRGSSTPNHTVPDDEKHNDLS